MNALKKFLLAFVLIAVTIDLASARHLRREATGRNDIPKMDQPSNSIERNRHTIGNAGESSHKAPTTHTAKEAPGKGSMFLGK